MTLGRWVRDLPSLRDFIAYVIVHAPDNFPVEDVLPAHEQMTLELAFTELQHGIGLLRLPAPHAQDLQTLLDTALQHYRRGDDVQGARLVHEFENKVGAAAR